MNRGAKTSGKPDTLRSRAEKLLEKRPAKGNRVTAAVLLHDLEVHKVELELQNEDLRQARDSLAASYNDLYDFAPVGYFTFDQNGDIRKVNVTCAEMLGRSRTELIGKKFANYVAPSSRRFFASLLKEIDSGKSKQRAGVLTLMKQTATATIHLEVYVKVTQWSKKEYQVVAVDMTEQRKTETALRMSEEFNRTLIDAIPDCVKTLDLHGNLLSMSAAGQKALGIQDVTLYLGKSWIDFWKPADQPWVREALAKARDGGVGRFQAPLPVETRDAMLNGLRPSSRQFAEVMVGSSACWRSHATSPSASK